MLLIALVVAGCNAAKPPAVSRLEIRATGLEIAIDSRGNGYFNKLSSKQTGRFSLSSDEFAELLKRTEIFRQSPDTITENKMLDYALHFHCSGPYVTDNGGITFHWTGPSLDEFYMVDYGCDRERNEARNRELRSILSSLPVPEPDSLP